jgi:cytochrome oxidase Cu insertion factor (SCO1/SenC/PrrC family)
VLVPAAALAGLLGLAACGAGAAAPQPMSQTTSAQGQAAAANPDLDPGTSLGGVAAPEISLVNQFGQAMSLSQFRGTVVLLSFDNALCTTVCPADHAGDAAGQAASGRGQRRCAAARRGRQPRRHVHRGRDGYSRARQMVNQWDFLAGTRAQLAAVWREYGIYAQVEQGVVDHTPAPFLIDQRGRERRIYLTAMACSSISQQAQVVAQQVSGLLPGHPALSRHVPLSAVAGLTPRRGWRGCPTSPRASGA